MVRCPALGSYGRPCRAQGGAQGRCDEGSEAARHRVLTTAWRQHGNLPLPFPVSSHPETCTTSTPGTFAVARRPQQASAPGPSCRRTFCGLTLTRALRASSPTRLVWWDPYLALTSRRCACPWLCCALAGGCGLVTQRSWRRRRRLPELCWPGSASGCACCSSAFLIAEWLRVCGLHPWLPCVHEH
jgi:hypothetical protein